MGLLDNYTGIGPSQRPTWQHQCILCRAMAKAGKEWGIQGFVMLPEATVTEDENDLAPDLVIFDAQFNLLSVIDVTTHDELLLIIEKCCELINRFPTSEFFVYDYEVEMLYKYESGEWVSFLQKELYCKYLSQPLINYLRN